MWRIILVSFIVAAALPAQPPAPAAEEAAVKSLIQRYVDARDARDSDAVAALFTADADQYTTAGDWRRGRAQVVAGTAASSRQNPGDRSIEIVSVRFITPDVAIADGNYRIGGTDGRRWTTIVAERE